MKEFFKAVWDFFVEWGELRYKALQRRGYSIY